MKDLNCWQSKFESCYYSDRLIDKIILLNEKTKNKVDINETKKAIYYAKKYHGNQKRDSGEPFYSHPLEVAYNVVDYIFTTDVLVTSILHDTLEDTQLTKEAINYIFNSNIATQVEALTRIKQGYKISSTEMIKMLFLKNNYVALIIKQLDRLHNMQTIKAKSPKKQKKITLETLQIFLPLAAHLGMLELEKQLSAICINTNDLNQYKLKCFSFQDSYQPLSLIFQSEIN